MITLALDTSQPVGSVSLARDGADLGTERFAQPSSHLVALSQASERLLAAAALAPRDVERIAVVIGPGSFTGLRIGLAFAKGLHASTRAALVPVDSLRLLALPLLETHARVCSMIDARRGEVYAAVHERAPDGERAANPSAARVVAAPCARAPQAFLESLVAAPDAFTGSGVAVSREAISARYPGALVAPDQRPDTAFLARIAPRVPALDERAVRELEPLYIRPSGAERVRLRRHGLGGDEGGPRD